MPYLSRYINQAATLLVIAGVFFTSAFCWGSPTFKFRDLKGDQLEEIGDVKAITQDAQGFMWFGGVNGLIRYDGYDMRIFRHAKDDARSLSNNHVQGLFSDSQGRLWVGTDAGLNRYHPETEDFSFYVSDLPAPNGVNQTYVSRVFEGDDGQIWATTYSHGLVRVYPDKKTLVTVELITDRALSEPFVGFLDGVTGHDGSIWLAGMQGIVRYNPKTLAIKHYLHDPGNPKSLSENFVRSIYQDARGDVWAGTESTLNLLPYNSDEFIHFTHDKNNPHTIGFGSTLKVHEDRSKNLWVANISSLDRFNRETLQFEHISPTLGLDSKIKQGHVRSIFEDRTGGLWIGTFPYGVSKLDPYESSFQVYQHIPGDNNTIANNQVMSVAATEKGNLWVGTGGGLSFVNRTTGKITSYRHDPDNPRSLQYNPVTALWVDKNNTLWVGTFQESISRFVPTQHEGEAGYFVRYPLTEAAEHNNITVNKIYADRAGDLWVSFHTGMARYNSVKDSFEFFDKDNKGNKIAGGYLKAMLESRTGEFWLGGESGLCLLQKDTFQVDCFEHDPSDKNSVHPGAVVALAEGDNGIWFGVHNGGLHYWDRRQGTFLHYSEKEGLPDNTVSDIVVDESGNLWLGTRKGIVKFNVLQKTFDVYDKAHGIAGNSHLRAIGITSDYGHELLFASTNGLTVFKPSEVFNDAAAPPIALTGFNLLNRTVAIGGQNSPLQHSISYTDKVTLNYQQSVFSFEFVALSYDLTERNQYAYMLDGFDADWNFVGSQRKATYTNIDPGEYSFRVKGANNEGVWNDVGASVDIKILPPWWRTWWAHSFYVLLAIVFLCSIVYALWNKKKAIIAHTEKLVRMQFFASISHEIRTPLTVIKGYAELLASKASPGTEIACQTNAIVEGANDLSEIVNEILDVSKLESGKFEVSRITIDLTKLILGLRETLFLMVRKKNVSASVELIGEVPQEIFSDPLRIKQIMMNLFANAVKFTESGAISLRISCIKQAELIVLELEDSGIGMSEDQTQKLFSAFMQADAAISRNYGGTGLGLFISKQFANFLGGDLSVTSQLGVGSCFKLTLATGDLARANWIDSLPLAGVEQSKTSVVEPSLPPALLSSLHGHVLYAEDNLNNQVLVREMFDSSHVSLTLVDNGLEAIKAIEKTMQDKPFDLVLIDLRMPVMGGVAVAKELKEKNIHVPLIAVTANFSDVTHEEFNQLGFDGFIEKPFNKLQFYDVVTPYLIADADNERVSLAPERNYLESQTLPSVLIVDDNVDLRYFMQQTLSRNFRCLLAEDAIRGQAVALAQVPDLIITDLMMPNRDGFEFVEVLRADFRTSHIPVVMLTAKADEETRKQAWRTQLDDFLAKPFSTEELLLRCQNLLGIRQLLSRRVSSALAHSGLEKEEVDHNALEVLSERDKNFVEKLSQYIAENFDNEDLNVVQISDHLAMSERQLRRKMKATLDQSVADFIRVFRLNKGAEYLKQGRSASETAYSVGFSSASYFSTCFKTHFGKSPKKYMESMATQAEVPM